MTRDELLTKLRELKPWLAEQGVVNLRLFGSFARDEAGPDSDVDLLVDIVKPMGLWDMMGVEHDMADQLGGRRVEFLTFRSIKNPYLRRNILTDALPV